MSAKWIECTCPECGHEEPASAADLRAGSRLVCRECGAHMEPDEEFEDDD